MSTEVRWLIRDGGKGAKEWRLNCTHWPGRLRRPWTATRTTKMLRQCPLAFVQQLVYYTVAVSTAVWSRVTRTMSIALLLSNNWSKRNPAFWASSTSLLLISSGLTWWFSTTSLLLISPAAAKLLCEGPAHLPPLDSARPAAALSLQNPMWLGQMVPVYNFQNK